MTIRIAMWSGPRNLSTAMMRSFGSRPDTFVSDEPFYGCFLKTTGADHPMRREVIAAMHCDWHGVIAALSADNPGKSPIWYQKHMWHQMVGPIGYDDFSGFTHAFLIREPDRMIASYLRKRESAPVYLLVDGRPKPVMVRVGATDGSYTAVSGDIHAGDRVIVGAGRAPPGA